MISLFLLQNSSLFIPRITESDLGIYQCVAMVTESPKLNATSESATIIEACMSIKTSQPTSIWRSIITICFNTFSDIDPFEESPRLQRIPQFDTIQLRCVTGYSAPPPRLTWQSDGILFTGLFLVLKRETIYLIYMCTVHTFDTTTDKIPYSDAFHHCFRWSTDNSCVW